MNGHDIGLLFLLLCFFAVMIITACGVKRAFEQKKHALAAIFFVLIYVELGLVGMSVFYYFPLTHIH